MARAAWPPDSVLTLGTFGTLGLTGGVILPAPGGDMYSVFTLPSASPTTIGIARVTTAGGLVYTTSNQPDWHLQLPGLTTDGAGGLIGAFSLLATGSNYDIAYRHLAPDGSAQPANSSSYYWAAQLPSFDSSPGAATDPAGGAYIAWPAGTSRYVLQRVTATGTVAAGWPVKGRRLNPPDSFAHPFAGPALLPDGSGGVFVLASEDVPRVWHVLSDTTLAPGWPASGIALGTGYDSYQGGGYPSDLVLVAGPTSHAFAAWLENDGTQSNSNLRVMVRSFDASGALDGPALALTPFSASIANLKGRGDGQSGLLLSWMDSGVLQIAHVLANGSLAFGPVAAAPADAHGTALTYARSGGTVAFWDDANGIWAQWHLSNGSLDPAEPVNPRLVHAHDAGRTYVYPAAALSDGDGGAYLLFDNGFYPDYPGAMAQMQHVFRSGVLDAGSPPRMSRLALTVAPNPARRALQLTVSLAGHAPANVELLDLGGRRVLARALPQGSRQLRLELPAGLAPGVYLVRVQQGSRAETRRVVVLE